MPCKLITSPTFPLLEQRLLADLQQTCKRDPLPPKWVVVPSATLANHLRARLARDAQQIVFANVRVVNLPRFAQQLSQSLTGRGTPPWSPVLDLMLFELVEELPQQSSLANLKQISGGAALLREAFTDLAEGGFGSEDLEKLEALAEEPDLAPRERELLQLYARWSALVRKRGMTWAPLSLQILPGEIESTADEQLARALCAERGQQPQILMYGFYDWIDVHLGWMGPLAQRVPTTIYYPWVARDSLPHPAFSFADSVLEHLRGRLPLDDEENIPVPAHETALFFMTTFPEGEIGVDTPSFLTCQPAAGVPAEAISAALRVRRWIDEEKIAPADILVVSPQAENYVEALQDIFGAFAIPLRVADVPAGTTPEGETLRRLAHIWEDEAPAEWVLALLRASPTIPAAKGLDIDRFEWKVRELGVWGGAAWREALKRRELKTEDEEKGRREIQFDEQEKTFIEALLTFVAEENTFPHDRLSVSDAFNVLKHIRDAWISTAGLLTPLLRAVEEMARHCPNLNIELRQWTRLLAESSGKHTLRDPLCQAVLFTPLMRARGVTARAVVILGLAAGQFPHRVQDDPVLSEEASAKLARWAEDLGHRFPVKARVTEEMQLLFFLLNTAAERIHWVVPETDTQGKAVAPTPWVHRYLQRWDAATLEASQGNPHQRRISRAPFEQAIYLADLDLERGSLLPPALAMLAAPNLSTVEPFLLDSVVKRGRVQAWSGCIGARPTFAGDRVGVTVLEALARCPYRFYTQTVARWEPLEVLSLSRDLHALTRGGLLHKLLEHAVQPYLGRTMQEIARRLLASDYAELWAVANSLPNITPDAVFALAILPPVFKEAALREVVEIAARYFESERDSFAKPRELEKNLPRGFPGLSGIQIVGKIDRIDDVETGPALLDYKSGKRPDDFRKQVKLGWHVQAALYPWLCDKPDADFSYIFLGRRKPEVGDARDAPSAESFLGELVPILKNGHFIPISNQMAEEEWGLKDVRPCQWCKFVSACRRFEPGSAHHHAELFESLAPARVAAMKAAVAPAGGRKKK